MKSPDSMTGALWLGMAIVSAGAFPAGAQPPPSAPVTPTITALNQFERTLTLGSNVLSTITPNIAQDMLDGITSGALDLREQFNYNALDNILTSFYFTVPQGAPAPTNLAQIPASSILGTSTLGISQIVVGSKPGPSATFYGAIANSSPTFFGSSSGAPAMFSFGFTNDTPPQINNVSELVAGVVVLYSPAATGSFTVFPPPGGGKPGPSSITISVTGNGNTSPNNTFFVNSSFATLDASASTSTAPGPLTFSWTPTPGYSPVGTVGANSAVLQLNGMLLGRTFQFMLTVTDSTGASASTLVTVTYV